MIGKCIIFAQRGSVELREFRVDPPAEGEILVETAFSCVSPGTELRVLEGKQMGQPQGAFPVIPGYAMVGRVIACGAEANPALLGRWVYCNGTERAEYILTWGGHVSHAVVRASEAVVLPEGIPLKEAALARLAAIAFRGVRLASPAKGERVAVLGLGPIGQLSARLFALAGAQVCAGGLNAEQVSRAQAAGIAAAQVERDSIANLKRLIPDGADIVVDATGRPAAVALAVQLAAEKPWSDGKLGGSRLVMQGTYGDDLLFPHHEAFVRELAVLWPRANDRDDLENIVSFLEKGLLKVNDLVSEVILPDAAPRIYARLREKREGLMTVLFDWSNGTAPERVLLSEATTAASPKSWRERWSRMAGGRK